MITRKLAPVLATGCTVVSKPAESTPFCAIQICLLLQDAGLPDGVINLVNCSDPAMVGDIFTSHAKVKKITFTGATQTGQLLAAQAGKHLKKISLELGGHAPFLVMPDADPVHAAKGAVLVKYLNTGQACISPNRIYVKRDASDAFINEFVSRVKKLKIGNGLDEGVGIGPLINQQAVEKMISQVEDAVGKGARLICGGNVVEHDDLANGHFFAPTVLTGVTPDITLRFHKGIER